MENYENKKKKTKKEMKLKKLNSFFLNEMELISNSTTWLCKIYKAFDRIKVKRYSENLK